MIDWGKLGESKTVVRCMDLQESEELALEVKREFPKKAISPEVLAQYFGMYPNTCYNLRLDQDNDRVTYGEETFYIKNGYHIVPYSDLVTQRDFGALGDSDLPIEFLFGAEEAVEC